MYLHAARKLKFHGTVVRYHLSARRQDRSEPPRHSKAQALAHAVHSFMNTFAGAWVSGVAPELSVVVERLAGEPRASPQRKRSARPRLPAPAAERAVERVPG